MRRGHRPSALPIVQFCAEAGRLGEEHGAARSAAISKAWHAKTAGVPGWESLYALLTDDEKAEVDSWPAPSDVELPGPLVLKYEAAEKEIPVAIDEWREPCAFDGDSMTRGYVDFAWQVVQWTHDCSYSYKVLYVADLKKSRFTVSGPDNLQNMLYGFALCAARKVRYFVPGLWIAEDAEWWWHDDIIDVESDEGEALWQRIVAAANNTDSGYCRGQHCRNCYGRRFCPEYALPVTVAQELLGPLASGQLPTSDEALELLLNIEATLEVAGRARENLVEWVKTGKLRIENGGKVWAPVMTKGRESVDIKALRAQLQAAADQFIKRGAPYPRMTWVKA